MQYRKDHINERAVYIDPNNTKTMNLIVYVIRIYYGYDILKSALIYATHDVIDLTVFRAF